MKLRIIIADDQHLFAESLKIVLEGEGEGEVDVCGIAQDGKEATELVASLHPDVVLIDIRMPIMDGVQATEHIHRRHPEIKIMILTTFDDDELAVSALSAGATGYVLKSVKPRDLLLSVRALASGAIYVAPTVGRRLVEKARRRGAESEREAELQTAYLMSQLHSVTRREAEILRLVARAYSNKEVASTLFISDKTVKNHLSSVYEKLSIHNRLQLINRITILLNDNASEPPSHST
jgi:DNA-binding NarL/FixJ family response regulator